MHSLSVKAGIAIKKSVFVPFVFVTNDSQRRIGFTYDGMDAV